jgi:hypothetical protein
MQVAWLARYTGWLTLVGACLALGACGGGDDGGSSEAADTQTITFQEPEDPGEDPFTPPADVEGNETVAVQQPFGGSGSNRVCDRDKLIKFLEDNPDRMAEWARVLGIEPEIGAVKKYIAKLHPVTLTQDTQVTNHSFTNGQAVPFQAILAAGTAVLVDEYGVPVVRCYCGNPLGPAVYTPEAKCTGCPPDYKPPKQCKFERTESYDQRYYRGDYYSNSDYDEVFISQSQTSTYSNCYKAYPDPKTVTAVSVYRAPPPAEPAPEPGYTGLQCDPPRSQLEAEQCAELEGNAPQYEPEPPADNNYDCPELPPAHPGEDYLRNCG